MSILHISQEAFISLTSTSSKPVLVDFWATWCGPCRMQAPILEDFVKQMGDRVQVCKVNVDEQPMLASEQGISSIPTLIFYQNGKEVKRLIGLRDTPELIAALQSLEA